MVLFQHLGFTTGIPWVRLSITVPIPVNTVPVKGTGINPLKTYTVLEYHRSNIKPVYYIYGFAFYLRCQFIPVDVVSYPQ